jgi:hypothetical protein
MLFLKKDGTWNTDRTLFRNMDRIWNEDRMLAGTRIEPG